MYTFYIFTIYYLHDADDKHKHKQQLTNHNAAFP